MNNSSNESIMSIPDAFWWAPYLNLAICAFLIVMAIFSANKALKLRGESETFAPAVKIMINEVVVPKYKLFAIIYGVGAIVVLVVTAFIL